MAFAIPVYSWRCALSAVSLEKVWPSYYNFYRQNSQSLNESMSSLLCGSFTTAFNRTQCRRSIYDDIALILWGGSWRMAAELYPTTTKKPALDTSQTSNTAVQQYQQQNISNNNTIQGCNWQGLYPTIRERYQTAHSHWLDCRLLFWMHSTLAQIQQSFQVKIRLLFS